MFAGVPSQSSLDTQWQYSTTGQAVGESERGQRVSRFSLKDDGPVPITRSGNNSATSLRPRQSEGSIRSAYTDSSTQPRPAYLTAFGADLKNDRSSVVSLQELEHGWGSNVAALNSSSAPQHGAPVARRGASTRRPYRPPFAPNADLDALEQVPEQPIAAGQNPPKRGRSLRERISGAINRSKSMDPATSSTRRNEQPAPVPRPAGPFQVPSSASINSMKKASDSQIDYVDVFDSENEPVAAQQSTSAATSANPARFSPNKDAGQNGGLLRKLSRARTLGGSHRRIQEPPPPKPSQEEIDKILLYAAPPEAGIKHAPMLSSYAPRPALRPRANTEGSATRLRPVPSISVGQARLAYAKSISRGNRAPVSSGNATSGSRPDVVLPPSYKRAVGASTDSVNNISEEGLMMATPRSRHSSSSNTRRSRTSRAVPEGWATGDRLLSTHEDDERKDNAHVKFNAI